MSAAKSAKAASTLCSAAALQTGFTLLELIVVVAILAIMSAAVVPIFQGSVGGIQSDHAVRDLVATIKYAQERAVSDGREYRVYLAASDRKYWVAAFVSVKGDDKMFEAIAERQGQAMVLPERLSLQQIHARKEGRTGLQYVSFLPNGACDKADLTLHDGRGRTVTIETNGTFGELKVKVS